ncbi:MAG: NADH-ubiquinone oxidoreductase [Parcubacteria group bacterium]|nr:NADH-ubiquinone oxidoreductase [Parcubacteria group bacterium]
MKPKEILVFGATGQIGRHLIRKLTKNNYKVVAVTRNIHQKGYILKTQANPGYLEIVELTYFNIEKIKNLVKECSICINLIGILFEKRKNFFKNIHTDFPDLLSKLSAKQNIEKLIHISSLGIEKSLDSNYAISKLDGENKIKNNFDRAVVLKPSIVYSVDDKFTTNFMTLLNRLPIMPIYYEGKTKFAPIHVTDLVQIIFDVVQGKTNEQTIECIGPEIFSFKEIILKLLKTIDKKRLLIPLPLVIAKMMAKIFEIMPNPLITVDQINLLKYDNISSGKYKTNFDLGLKANRIFDEEIEKYSFNWRTGGQFSRNKFSNTN